MIKGLFASVGLAATVLGGIVWAQNPGASTAPAINYYLGPSLGNLFQNVGSYQYSAINAQTGTTYTILKTDIGKLVILTNGSAIAVTVPVASTAGFEVGKCFAVVAEGAGTATLTPTTSTINGQATKTYATSAGGWVCSDGTNYHAI